MIHKTEDELVEAATEVTGEADQGIKDNPAKDDTTSGTTTSDASSGHDGNPGLSDLNRNDTSDGNEEG